MISVIFLLISKASRHIQKQTWAV